MRTWLKELRQKNQLTQLQMAEKLEITESYYGLVEKGARQKKMNIVMISKLAEIFGISAQEIIKFETQN